MHCYYHQYRQAESTSTANNQTLEFVLVDVYNTAHQIPDGVPFKCAPVQGSYGQTASYEISCSESELCCSCKSGLTRLAYRPPLILNQCTCPCPPKYCTFIHAYLSMQKMDKRTKASKNKRARKPDINTHTHKLSTHLISNNEICHWNYFILVQCQLIIVIIFLQNTIHRRKTASNKTKKQKHLRILTTCRRCRSRVRSRSTCGPRRWPSGTTPAAPTARPRLL